MVNIHTEKLEKQEQTNSKSKATGGKKNQSWNEWNEYVKKHTKDQQNQKLILQKYKYN